MRERTIKSLRKRPAGNINVKGMLIILKDIRETYCEDMNWIELVQDVVYRWAFSKRIMDIWA
jgi:hypothetical protein